MDNLISKLKILAEGAKYFITCDGRYHGGIDIKPEIIKYKLSESKIDKQLSFF